MPRAVLAIRSYPITMLIALCVFLLTLAITTGSLGTVSGGGDDGDGGSGMGGTGKSGEFGGSGFGGTGAPSPFFTSTDTQEQQTNPSTPAPSFELRAPVLVAQDPQNEQPAAANTQESISQRVIEAIESSPLIEETRIEIAQDEPRSGQADESAPQDTPPLQLVELQSPLEQPALDILQRPENPSEEDSAAQEQRQLALAEEAEQESADLAESALSEPQIAETIAVKMDTEQQASEQTRDRDGLPERIQRPDLPPFQRFQRVERPALMPPRVQPMRI